MTPTQRETLRLIRACWDKPVYSEPYGDRVLVTLPTGRQLTIDENGNQREFPRNPLDSSFAHG